MKITLNLANNDVVISIDKQLKQLNEDEYYALLTNAIQALQFHLLDQYVINDKAEDIS
jgi:molybdopterin biosynthesis enzyme MoaB